MSVVLGYLYTAWRWLLSNKAAQIALALIAAFGWHKARVWQAKQEAVKEEREEAKQEAHEKEAEHEGDIYAARQRTDEQQEERREREQDEDPRDRFGRDPFQ